MALDADQRLKLELIISGSEEAPEALNPWETGFVSSFIPRFEEYGDDTRISEKQWDILNRIYDQIIIAIEEKTK